MSAARQPMLLTPSTMPSGERIVAWLVLLLMAACVGLAIYDLWLLLSFAR